MWTRQELKYNAKALLSRYYWMGFAVTLVSSILGGGASYINGIHGTRFEMNLNLPYGSSSSGFSFTWSPFWAIFTGFFLFFSIVVLLYGIFIGNLIEVGKDRFFMESRSHLTKFTTLFAGFKGNYWNVLKTLFMRDLFVFLWSLLFLIPGIIKHYEYRMVPYLLAENPNMEYRRALELSRAMMEGEKFNFFVLELSFLGYLLLGALACGVGILFVEPYIEATYAEFYTCMRTKALSTGLSTPSELMDFLYPAMP